MGGDEFLIVLPDLTDPDGPATVARKLHDVLQGPFELAGRDVRVTASLGVCVYPKDAPDLLSLHRGADAAVYRSKHRGRNRYEFAADVGAIRHSPRRLRRLIIRNPAATMRTAWRHTTFSHSTSAPRAAGRSSGTLGDGRLTLEEHHRFPNPTGRMNGHLYWNLLAQWEELKTGLRKAAEGTAAAPAGRRSAASASTRGASTSASSAPTATCSATRFTTATRRTDGVMEQAFATVAGRRSSTHTGMQFMQLNSLYQLLALHNSKPGLLEAAETLLFMPDLFNYLFTGERKAEFSIATTSQMYDPRKGTWADDMLEQLGLPTHILPEIVPSGTVIGPLRDDVAEECDVGPHPGHRAGVPRHRQRRRGRAADAADGGDWCYISSGHLVAHGRRAERAGHQ